MVTMSIKLPADRLKYFEAGSFGYGETHVTPTLPAEVLAAEVPAEAVAEPAERVRQ
jgi:hypothetical protein